MTGSNDLPLEWATEEQLVEELSRRNVAVVVGRRRDEKTTTTVRFKGDPGWCMAVAGDVHKMVVTLTHNGATVDDESDARDS